MPAPPIPVSRYLVPEERPRAPEGFTQLDRAINDGLPFNLQLNAATTLVLVVPNGLAHTWRDADPSTVVTRSDEELAPHTPAPATPVGDVTRPAARLIARRGGLAVGSLPLAAGLRRYVPERLTAAGESLLEVLILSWDIRAGSLRGAGDFGSRISLCWREADRAVTQFSTPPVDQYARPRLIQLMPVLLRVESILDLAKQARQPARFKSKKALMP